MTVEQAKIEILQWIAILASLIGPDEAAAWLEEVALDIEELPGK